MKTTYFALLTCWALSASGQNWSVGAATGPFVFGDFVRRTIMVGVDGSSERLTATLSAAVRPGLALDVERRFGNRYAIRMGGTFTRSPLIIEGDEEELESGDMDVATFMLPLVMRINRGGAIRFHIMGGPAYAGYRIVPRQNASGTIRVFRGTRMVWGWAYGGGVAWHWSDRFSWEGQIADTTTESPFRESDFPSQGGLEIPRTHNVSTTVGLRYRF